MRSEFELIDHLKAKFGLRHVGDDCAVLPKDAMTDMVVTADMLVENIDFRLDWATPETIGHKALAVSLSDVAAMGGTPDWAMVSIAVPEERWRVDFVERFYDGWHSLASESGVELVGGDISRSTGPVVIDSIVGGSVPKGRAILRSGARAGNLIYVSGSLGGAAAGLKLLERGDEESLEHQQLIEYQLKPMPQIRLAKLLQNNGSITSMIDLSDGLSSDLQHLCDASGVGARIYADRVPIVSGLGDLFGTEDRFAMVMDGGEDFELLFTSAAKKILLPENHSITCIGETTSSPVKIELIRADGTSLIEPKGYRHF